MADALCGPSNPLQQFQKQTSTDRTLQQDRLVSRQNASQGFRSAPGPNAGALDPEFDAFQAGVPLGPVQGQPLHHQFPHNAHTQNYSPTSPVSGWAADFQRLQISQSPSPAHQQQRFPPQAAASSSWHQEFLRQQQQSQPSFSSQMQHSQPQQMYGPGVHHSIPDLSAFHQPQMNMGQAPQTMTGKGKQREDAGEFDAAAFERAFEEAAAAEMLSEEERIAQEVGHEHPLETTNHLAAQAELEQQNAASMGDVEAAYLRDGIAVRDLLQDEIDAEARQKEQQDKSREDGDELARTAGQLLDSVKDNQSQKFQDSQFLGLMRKIRDREVVVEGDKMVDVSAVSA